jgi:hypothetical protein
VEKKRESSLIKPLVDKKKDRDVSDAMPSLKLFDFPEVSSLKKEDQEQVSPALLDAKKNKRDVLSVISSLQEIELSPLYDVHSAEEQSPLPILLCKRASSNRYAKFRKSGETVRNPQENEEMPKGVKTAIEMSRIR